MTLQNFLNLTASIPEPKLRRALALALSAETTELIRGLPALLSSGVDVDQRLPKREAADSRRGLKILDPGLDY